MSPELEKDKLKVGLEVLGSAENGSVPGDKGVQCISNYDRNFHVDAFHDDHDDKAKDGSEEMEVNIIERKKLGDVGQIEARCEDATESMSSFGGTISEAENGSGVGDMEVESHLYVRNDPTFLFDGYRESQTRKKLTDHWRRFIRPLMWRCKWIELQIREFLAQALKYDRELTEHEHRKQFGYHAYLVDGFDAKSLPYSSCNQRKKVMKRKKRKRFEETTDIASYMSQHKLFSYYENKKPAVNGAYIGDDCGNIDNGFADKITDVNNEFGSQDEWASLESRGNDKIYEHTLRKIEVLQLQVHTLRARIEKAVRENPGKFSSLNRLSLPGSCDALTRCDQNHASLTENGEKMPVRSAYAQHLSEATMEDAMLGSAVSNHEGVIPFPGMIESTSRPQVGGSCENNKVGILIQNQAANEEMESYKNFGSQLADNPQEPPENTAVQSSEDNLPAVGLVPHVRFGGKTLPKSRSNVPSSNRSNVSGFKTKRGRRKSGTGARGRRSSG